MFFLERGEQTGGYCRYPCMKFFARSEKASKKGIPIVLITDKQKIQTGIYCSDGKWDHKNQRIKGNHNDSLKLAQMKIDVEKYLLEGKKIDEIRELLKTKKTVVQERVAIPNMKVYDKLSDNGKSFYKEIEKLIKSHEHDWSEGYKKRFRSIRKKILEHDPHFYLSKLNDEWWRGYTAYCIEEYENTNNTLNTDAKAIKALMKEFGIPGHDKIKWGYIEPEILGLSWDKVLKLDDSEFVKKIKANPKETLNDSRILFLIGCFTGRRWSEIEKMTKDNFYELKGEWRYKNIGKGRKPVDLPLLPEAVAFLKKIKFEIPRLTGQTVNEDIKQICQIAGFKTNVLVITPISASVDKREVLPEYETIHFHTSRHSYAIHVVEIASKAEALSNGELHKEKYISWMLGHASFATTWKYINRAASSNEKTHQKVMEIMKGAA